MVIEIPDAEIARNAFRICGDPARELGQSVPRRQRMGLDKEQPRCCGFICSGVPVVGLSTSGGHAQDGILISKHSPEGVFIELFDSTCDNDDAKPGLFDILLCPHPGVLDDVPANVEHRIDDGEQAGLAVGRCHLSGAPRWAVPKDRSRSAMPLATPTPST